MIILGYVVAFGVGFCAGVVSLYCLSRYLNIALNSHAGPRVDGDMM